MLSSNPEYTKMSNPGVCTLSALINSTQSAAPSRNPITSRCGLHSAILINALGDTVGLAADNQVCLAVEESDKAVAKHGKRVHDEDTFFFDGRLPNAPSHCFHDRVSKTKCGGQSRLVPSACRGLVQMVTT